MEIYGKAVASIESTDDDKFGPNGGFTAVLSTPSLDRDGDRLHRDEWQDLPDWLPLDVDHGMSMADTVGKFHPYWDGDRMMMDAYFASTARSQETRTLLNDLKDEASGTWPVGVSVAFLTDKSRKDGEPSRELLNAGIVAIPSNRDAVILASKAASENMDPRARIAGIDAIIDEAVCMSIDLDRSALPEEVGQALDLLVGAQETVASIMRLMGIFDPDGSYEKSFKSASVYSLIAALDAIIDEACEMVTGINRATIPEPAAQALDLIVGADEAVDALMESMNIYDSDHGDEEMDSNNAMDEDKSVAGVITKAGNGDLALTQAIHDASVHLGASCMEPGVDEDSGASSGANKSCQCWDGYERVPGTTPCSSGSCRKCDDARKSAENLSVDKSTNSDKVASIDLEAIKPEGLTMEQFKNSLSELISPKDSSEEPAPAAKAAAASPADLAMAAQLLKMRARTLIN